jgi:transposase
VSVVEKLLRLHRRTGVLEPDRRWAGRPAQIDAATCAQVQRWLEEHNNLTLAKLAERLEAQCGLCVSINCVWRLMQRLHMRRKKSVHASERDTLAVLLARQLYRTQLATCAPTPEVVDESGCNIAMTRRYGRAQYGRRVPDAVPKNFELKVTILGALSCIGLDAVMTVEGATDTAVFRAYVEQVLVRTLVVDDNVIMDKLSVHNVSGIGEAIEATGARLLYLLPYSPDYSAIESWWSKLKAILRKAKARTRDALDEALTQAIEHITRSDTNGWFNLCGYAVH